MSRLSDSRQTLYTALSHVFDTPVGSTPLPFSPGRVEPYPPSQPVSPTVWIEQPSGSESIVGQLGTVLVDAITFPVAIVYDGTDRAQVSGLDELVARVWDAARTVGHPVRFEPRPIDVGGPSLRGTFVDVEMTVGALTFCPVPELTTQEVA